MDVGKLLSELMSKPNSYFCIQSECENANLRDVSKLIEEIYDEKYIMAIQQCVIGSYLDNAKKDPNILNNILTEISRSDSIISLDILGIPNTVLVKHDQPENKRLIIDIYIGLHFINSLRREIPNFIYTYGSLVCGAPSGSKLCSRKYLEEIYGFFEYVDMSERFPDGDFINILLQVLLSLQVAYEGLGFVHRNLVPENIILRDPPYGRDIIQYDTRNGTYYLKCNKVATIINFGYSSVDWVDSPITDSLRLLQYLYRIFPQEKAIFDIFSKISREDVDHINLIEFIIRTFKVDIFGEIPYEDEKRLMSYENRDDELFYKYCYSIEAKFYQMVNNLNNLIRNRRGWRTYEELLKYLDEILSQKIEIKDFMEKYDDMIFNTNMMDRDPIILELFQDLENYVLENNLQNDERYKRILEKYRIVF